MKAIIPVAGIGTRLQPLTNKTPKVLINVAGKPMLFHLIDELIKSGKIGTIILIIGYLGEQIRDAIAKTYGNSNVKFEYAEQKETLGLGHAVYHAKKFVKDEPVLIVLGDTIFEFDLNSVLANEYSAIGVKDVEDTSRFGIVENENGFVKRMIEKPAPGTTNSKAAIAGVYFVKEGQRLFKSVEYLMANDIKTKNEFQLTDALMKLVMDGEKMIVFEIENWFDCGKPETLLSTNSYLLNRDYKAEQQYEFTGTSVYPPVFIGEGVDIKNAHIGPNVTIADGSKVKNSCVTNSIILENAVAENAELDYVVLGAGEHITGIQTNIVKADNIISSF
ncbi:MAG: NTP transferase domain-containing protein [Chlorobi bacterium]|nr:NTP transferase domain-containing protein [Chlorobiota bacterium]MCI0715583.1 NTP transferase domain-containing protein [Chlorobiota bacterium]